MNHRRYTYLVGEDILLLKRRYTSFLKETHRSFIRGGMGALLLMLLLLTACVGEELQKPLLGEGEGYLTLQIGAISAEVTSSTLTKATVPNAPTEEKLMINIKQSDGSSVDGFPMLYANLPDPLVLKAGVTYTVAASYGTDEALQESPYFYGSDSIYIQANTNNQVSLAPSLANAMIIPVVTDSLRRHYKNDWTLTASVGKKSFTLASAKGIDTLYAKAGETAFTFTGTNLIEKKITTTWSRTFDAGYAYQLQCNPDLDAFKNIQVTATVKHTYDNGYLTGTEVELNSNLMEANKEAIKEWNVAIEYNGQIIRTYKGNDAPNITMERIEDWPYIPQSSELSASVTLKSEDVIAVSSTFTVPEPKFEVEVSGDTSCSVYDRSGATEANKKDGSSIFDITSSVSISQTILDNYTELLSPVTYSVDEDSTKAALGTLAKLDSLSWAEHKLKASVTFDSTTIDSPEFTCHVTGLPYKAKPPKNEGSHAWMVTNIGKKGHEEWEDSEFKMYTNTTPSLGKSDYCKIASPYFHLTKNVPISITISAHGNMQWPVTYDVTGRVYTSDNAYADYEALYNDGQYKDYKIQTLNLDVVSKRIEIENREHTALNTMFIQSVFIDYR